MRVFIETKVLDLDTSSVSTRENVFSLFRKDQSAFTSDQISLPKFMQHPFNIFGIDKFNAQDLKGAA